MQVAAFQCPVRMDVSANLGDLEAALSTLNPQTLIVAPEGLLSGYLPEAGFVSRLDNEKTVQAIEHAGRLAAHAQVHLIAGACVRIDGRWRNSSFYFGPEGQTWRYDKINLAWSERGDFIPGDSLPVLNISLAGTHVRIGVQMCREIRYPEQWRWLALQGVQIMAYVNNAVGSAEGYGLWRGHVVSRAAEMQRFVVGANNAASDQTCTTLVVAPSGHVLAEAPVGKTVTATAQIDLSNVSNWVIDQARTDVVAVTRPNIDASLLPKSDP